MTTAITTPLNDHCDLDAFAAYRNLDVPVIAPGTVVERARATGFTDVRLLEAWDSTMIGHLTVTATPAEHGVHEVTYVIQSADRTVYFGGDTLYIPELDELPERFGHFDLALMPTNGLCVRPMITDTDPEPLHFAEAVARLAPDTIVRTVLPGVSVTIEADHSNRRSRPEIDTERPAGQRSMIADVRALAGHEDQLRGAVMELAAAVRRETGCVALDAFESYEHTGHFHLVESYDDSDAFRAHLDTPHVQEFRAALRAHGTSTAIDLTELVRLEVRELGDSGSPSSPLPTRWA